MAGLVYTALNGTSFHATEGCQSLSRSNVKAIQRWDLGQVQGYTPCRRCYPEAKLPRSIKVRCQICSPRQVQACKHNGGVLVMHQRKINYVWPETAHRFTLVNPVTLD